MFLYPGCQTLSVGTTNSAVLPHTSCERSIFLSLAFSLTISARTVQNIMYFPKQQGYGVLEYQDGYTHIRESTDTSQLLWGARQWQVTHEPYVGPRTWGIFPRVFQVHCLTFAYEYSQQCHLHFRTYCRCTRNTTRDKGICIAAKSWIAINTAKCAIKRGMLSLSSLIIEAPTVCNASNFLASSLCLCRTPPVFVHPIVIGKHFLLIS